MRITLAYYAALREARGLSEESIETSANTVAELFQELWSLHTFPLDPAYVRAATDDGYLEPSASLREGTTYSLIPPVAGG